MNLDQLNARGIINVGNLARFSKVMKKAIQREPITIGFLGGSITMGSLSSKPTTCYAYKVYEWWEQTFPNCSFTYVNAGIGATTSKFGIARLDSDLLCYKPDMVFIEYSVNDEDNDSYQESFEACIRKTLESSEETALLMFNNVEYDSGHNAQRVHNEIGSYYDLPIVSMKESIYQALLHGEIQTTEITPDNLHPNDAGHALLAGVITNLLEAIYEKTKVSVEEFCYRIPTPYTRNRYIHSKRYHNKNCKPVLYGFEEDKADSDGITDVFKHGWRASKVGDSISFEFNSSLISILYRKTIQQPAPIARAVMDGMEDSAIILDGNFEETWGDKLELQELLLTDQASKHTLTITIIEAHEGLASDFYLAGIIY